MRAKTADLKRLILFVPNDRRSLLDADDRRNHRPGHAANQWLSNATGTDAAAYRTALRQKARAIVSKTLKLPPTGVHR